LPGFEEFPFRAQYHGLCDLCLHINSNPEAAGALRERLARPEFAVQRLAARRVIEGSRRAGELSRDYVNSIGARRVLLSAMTQPAAVWAEEAGRIMGRADIDWNNQAAYVTRCGLARPLLPALKEPALQRWAPPFFVERITQRALQDSRRELLQRDIVALLAQALSEINATGVLLKGIALQELALQADWLRLHVHQAISTSMSARKRRVCYTLVW
jgi:hypothetical protein